MRNVQLSRKSTVLLPCLALLYVLALIVLVPTIEAAVPGLRRTGNVAWWGSTFAYNQAQGRFPASTRSAIANNGAAQWTQWTTGANFQVNEWQSGANAWIEGRSFLDIGYDTNYPGETRHMAQNNRITFSTTYLNADWTWKDNTCSASNFWFEADVRLIIVHEVGHWISLLDNPGANAVMNPDGRCRLITTDDDRRGVRGMYP